MPYFKTNIAIIAIGSEKNGRHRYPKWSFLSEPRRLFEICLIAQRIHRPWSLGRSKFARLSGSVAGSHCDGNFDVRSANRNHPPSIASDSGQKLEAMENWLPNSKSVPTTLFASSLCHSHILESCYISIATAAIVWLQLWKEFGAGVRGDSSESEMN